MRSIAEHVKDLDGKVFRGSDAINHEGEKAWKMTDKELLMQYAYTGVLGNTFYVTQKDIIDEAIELVKRSDAKDLSEAIILGRNEGYIRAFPILGLVYLSMKDSNIFKETFPKIIYTGNDLEDFINICHKVRGFGRSIKKVMSDWIYEHVNPYYALKYRKQIADAIRISRVKCDDSIYAFILKDYIDVDKKKLEYAYQEYKELNAFRKIPELLKEQKYSEVADLIIKNRLDVDSLTAYYNQFNKEIWEAIAIQSPVMRFLKYLSKFERVGIDVAEIAKKKITVENLNKAKVFPFRLFMVYRSLNNMAVANIIANVLDDYIKQYDWGKFNEKSWAICPDVSGSMNSGSPIAYIDIAAMLTAFMIKGIKDVTVLPWASQLKDYKLPFADSVISHMKEIKNMGGGGTNMGCSLKYLYDKNIAKDCFVFITDTEHYTIKSYYDKSNNGTWLEEWIKYHNKFPKSKAIIIRGDAYNTRPMSEEQCKKYNIYQIFGWNDKVVDYIQRIV